MAGNVNENMEDTSRKILYQYDMKDTSEKILSQCITIHQVFVMSHGHCFVGCTIKNILITFLF